MHDHFNESRLRVLLNETRSLRTCRKVLSCISNLFPAGFEKLPQTSVSYARLPHSSCIRMLYQEPQHFVPRPPHDYILLYIQALPVARR
jgi:hypothetical protein